MIRKVLIASASALMLVPSLSMGALNAKAYNTNDENESAQLQELSQEGDSEAINVPEEVSNEDQIFMEYGTKNEVNVKETDDSIVITVKNEEGNTVFTREKDENYIYIDSDYLSDDEITNLEEETNNVQVDSDNVNSKSLTLTEMNQIEPMAQTGNWAWSSWQNHTVTTEGKTTASAIATAILSYIPVVGPFAGAFATIFIQNEMQTGYFSTSQGSRMDTNPAYIWRSSKVK